MLKEAEFSLEVSGEKISLSPSLFSPEALVFENLKTGKLKVFPFSLKVKCVEVDYARPKEVVFIHGKELDKVELKEGETFEEVAERYLRETVPDSQKATSYLSKFKILGIYDEIGRIKGEKGVVAVKYGICYEVWFNVEVENEMEV